MVGELGGERAEHALGPCTVHVHAYTCRHMHMHAYAHTCMHPGWLVPKLSCPWQAPPVSLTQLPHPCYPVTAQGGPVPGFRGTLPCRLRTLVVSTPVQSYEARAGVHEGQPKPRSPCSPWGKGGAGQDYGGVLHLLRVW